MIITLEGVPAVGKSTIAKILESEFGFYRVAEVNELFPLRPSPESDLWYAKRQIERAKIARSFPNSVLDGDVFQVVWFSWLYPELKISDPGSVMEFLLSNASSISLPSFYCYLYVENDCRLEREKVREAARGHNYEQFLRKFNRYADMLEPQMALFEAIDREYPGWVLLHENKDAQLAIRKMLGKRIPDPPNTREYLSWLKAWLLRNEASRFKRVRL